jgi:hypothetical protein
VIWSGRVPGSTPRSRTGTGRPGRPVAGACRASPW